MAVVLFGEETFYDRQLPHSMQPPRNSRFQRLIGVEQWRSRRLRNSFAQAMMRAIRTVSKPVVLMADLYYACTFAWVVAINATLALFVTPLYNFGPKQIGTIPLPTPSSLIEHPPLHKSTSAALTPFPSRLLLLRPHRRDHPRRDHRPLAARPDRQNLHPPPQRPPRTRSPPQRHLRRSPIHGHRSFAARVLPRASLPLHAHRIRVGDVRLRYHGHVRGHQRLPARCVSSGERRSRRLDQFCPNRRGVHRGLFPGDVGVADGRGEDVWDPGGDLRGGFSCHHCLADLREETEDCEWGLELQD